MTTFIRLNQLVVMRSGHRVYDQTFHEGLNIIRGANNTGKSSIADLIFFAMGGELKKWKEYALMCDEVIAEVTLSGAAFTLRRDIDDTPMRPIKIFAGPMEEAIVTASDGWVLANFARDGGDRRRSFSQILFDALGLPEIPGDGGANITMHQILRLMYVDQTSPFQRIFRVEDFDPKDTREAIAELMCGIGGYDLYDKRLERRSLKTNLDKVSARFSNLAQASTAFGENLSVQSIEAEQGNIREEQEALYRELDQIEHQKVDQSAVAKEAADARHDLHSKLAKTRTSIVTLERDERSLQLEIEDSEAFIRHLEGLLVEFDSAALAFTELGNVSFSHCPSCFAPVTEAKEGCCHLCGTEVSEEDKKAKALQLRMDLVGQIKESQALQRERKDDINAMQVALRRERSLQTRLTKQLDELSRAPVDGRSALISQKSREIGKLDSRLTELEKLSEIAKELGRLSEEKKRISDQMDDLDEQIAAIERSQKKRKAAVFTSIAENTKYFLRKDMEEHSDFKKIENFSFSFEDDWFAVNDDPNIAENASGMVMLKNCLILGILKSSLEDPKMLFPKFIVQDNGEDKGMVGDRVRHFQKTMATWSDQQTEPHQIILTTSTPNPELVTDSQYTVGPHYTAQNKTLAIQ